MNQAHHRTPPACPKVKLGQLEGGPDKPKRRNLTSNNMNANEKVVEWWLIFNMNGCCPFGNNLKLCSPLKEMG
jgi:hypothetical protein